MKEHIDSKQFDLEYRGEHIQLFTLKNTNSNVLVYFLCL